MTDLSAIACLAVANWNKAPARDGAELRELDDEREADLYEALTEEVMEQLACDPLAYYPSIHDEVLRRMRVQEAK